MIEAHQINFDQPVPIFPLPNCMLLPHATVPLHVFEPRYRQMTKDVLNSHGLIAMATFDGDDWKTQYMGNPTVRDHVCVGYVVKHEELDDGRYNIWLQGVCRARIVEEIDHEPYRIVELDPTEPMPILETDLSEQREQIEQMLNDPLLKEVSAFNVIRNCLSIEISTAALIDLALMAVCETTDQRYRMLAEDSVRVRTRHLVRMLSDTRTSMSISQRCGQTVDDDGVSLN